MKFFIYLGINLISGLGCLSTALAKPIRGQAINFYVENDTRDIGGPGSDNAYTSGIKISYISAEDDIPAWAKPMRDRSEIFREALKKSKSNFGISIGQQIFTPNDIRASGLIQDDRPYAAWLYLGLSAHFQNDLASHSLELDVGVIGPEAGGQNIQNGVHKIIGKYYAEGWKNQLRTEPTLQISYQQRFGFFELSREDQTKYLDIIPFFGGGIGNVSVDAHAGGMLRFGHQLPDDFGPTRPSLTDGDNFVTPIAHGFPKSSLYVFVAGRGVAVARNIFLDGNTFKSSHSVKKNPLLAEAEVGVVGIYRRWSLAWRFVTRSPEFAQRNVINSFASVSIAYAF